MIKKVLISFLTIFAFGLSFYTYVTVMSIDSTQYGETEVILFVIPFTMLLLNGNLYLLLRLKIKGFPRFEKGLNTIFLSLSILLFVLHIGLVLLSIGREVNLLLLVPIIIGVVLIITANTLPRFKVELSTSSSPLTNISEETWNRLIRPISYPLFIGGILILLCVFLPGSLMLVAFFTILLSTILVSIFRSYKILHSAQK
ncbi:hypothetical protein [Psychrobacillus vulpis]|uniref:SdpI family protein n=1 Tax=Psychrobacillus vulpis TaxID=2325572 RepID=A0A544TS82_9BACI|nr:hypothetical protein [Psychrobacillus vulpis]TQR20304.1 hypothetical protein FG384_07625 [Psychrobacillus vulpis]